MAAENPLLGGQLELFRCPHCGIAQPLLSQIGGFWGTRGASGSNARAWAAYCCSTCGGMVLAAAAVAGSPANEIYPRPPELDQNIPDPARAFLRQSIESMHAPAGAVMLAASAIDAMLKAKGYREGTLYNRIEKAAEDHLITEEMSVWAHEVRLDANDQRHADENAGLPGEGDAQKAIEFAKALAEFLFVLPARVRRGRGQPQSAATGAAQA